MAEGAHVILEVEDPLPSSMERKLKSTLSHEWKKQSATIHRVLPTVRNKGRSDYDPKIVSIGPYHRRRKALRPMEPLKWRYLHDLLGRSSEHNKLDKYIKKVRDLEPQARAQYSEAVELDGDAFAEMMVVDGCFIIEFLIRWYLDKERGELDSVCWNQPLLKNDLLLLENQIPFFVLQALFDASVVPELMEEAGDEEPITLTEMALYYLTRDEFKELPQKPPHHLLHLYHFFLRSTATKMKESAADSLCVTMATWPVSKARSFVGGSLFWLLSLLLSCKVPSVDDCDEDEESCGCKAPRVIGNATQLREAGIKFKARKKAVSFLEVTFRNGIMQIPVLPVQEGTPSLFRNLLALEQCCPWIGSQFTSYAVLMNNLIDSPEDVAVLKECGIIESKLGGDEEVADLFNNLCKGGTLDYEKHDLVQLFIDVKKYRDADRHRWRARLVHDYFGNPWATISLLAAIVLLLLTMLQTFYTVFPYYHPRDTPAPSPATSQ